MNRNLSVAAAALCTLAGMTAAQDVTTLAPIVVSGGLTPIEATKYGRSATVITAEEIEQRGITTVQEALRAVPGVSVSGAGHSQTQVRIRGGEGNHTLILIDGVEATGGDGEYFLTGLETANIERIEVLRGPQSVYYGSNASAGVINIITRKGSGTGYRYGGTVEIGDGWASSVFLSARTGRGGLSLGIAKRQDDGYDYSGSDGEEDGIDRLTFQLAGDYLIAEGLTLGMTFRRSEEDFDSDSTSFTAMTAQDYVVDDPTQFSHREEQTAQVYLEYEGRGGRAQHRLSFERSDYDQSYNGGTPTETETTAAKYRFTYGLDGQVSTANHLINVLLEHEKDSSSANAAYERETRSLAVEYRGSFANGLDLQFGARRDDNSVFQDVTTWNASLSYSLASGVRLHASAGTGVVNPTYFELYANENYGGTIYLGNPNLSPERNRAYDLGVEVPVLNGRGVFDVTYFNETLEDEITLVMTGANTFSYVNQTGQSDREGFELTARVDATDALSFRLDYTRLMATNPDGSIEVRRPKHELGLGATLKAFNGRGTVNIEARHVAGNFDDQFFGAYSTAELPDYTVVNLGADYALTDAVKLTARVVNVFDEEYSDVWGYASRGRTAYLGLSANW